MTPSDTIVIFDWNGTLFNCTKWAWLCSRKAIASRVPTFKLTLPALQNAFDMPYDRYYRGLGFGSAFMRKHVDEVNQHFMRLFKKATKKAALRPGATELLKGLKDKGTPSIVLSNHFTSDIHHSLEKHGAREYVGEILARSETEQHSAGPKGKRLLRLVNEKGLDQSKMIFVGDTVEEIILARFSGARSIAITGGYASRERLEAERPTCIVNTMQEMQHTLKAWGLCA